MASDTAGRMEGETESERVLMEEANSPKMAAASSKCCEWSSSRGSRRSTRGENLLLSNRYWQLGVWPVHVACRALTASSIDLGGERGEQRWPLIYWMQLQWHIAVNGVPNILGVM